MSNQIEAYKRAHFQTTAKKKKNKEYTPKETSCNLDAIDSLNSISTITRN